MNNLFKNKNRKKYLMEIVLHIVLLLNLILCFFFVYVWTPVNLIQLNRATP